MESELCDGLEAGVALLADVRPFSRVRHHVHAAHEIETQIHWLWAPRVATQVVPKV